MAASLSSACLVSQITVLLFLLSFGSRLTAGSYPPLTLDYYAKSCPAVLEIVKKEMECAVLSDPRNAAYIAQLHFHDCFVQGCDGSVLLDDTVTLRGEKLASTNIHSLDGFRIIDRIKNKLESECPDVVSCADILTIAARDAILLVGGPYWDVPLGRKDSRTASYELAMANLPSSDESLPGIIAKFLHQGLSVTDMVALAGTHTIGMARCENFRSRIYSDYVITSPKTASSELHLKDLKSICPLVGGDDNVAPLDNVTPYLFDNSFYHRLINGEGLLNSDQEMYSSILAVQTKEIVKKYALDPIGFFVQFSESFVKLGNITNPESFVAGEVRKNCRFVNTAAQKDSA